jgi:hypothetical protein
MGICGKDAMSGMNGRRAVADSPQAALEGWQDCRGRTFPNCLRSRIQFRSLSAWMPGAFPWAIAQNGHSIMIPSKKELALLVVLSVGCTLIVGLLPQRDIGLMCCGGSLTLVAALLGYRRNQIRLAILAEEQRVKSEE